MILEKDNLRDWFAAMAIPSCMAIQERNVSQNMELLKALPEEEINSAMIEGVADLCYQVADAMMKRKMT